MYGQHLLMKMDHERRLEQGARERMLHSLRASRPGFKCMFCGKLAALLLKASQGLQEMSGVKPMDDLPEVSIDQLRRMLDERRPAVTFFN